MENYTIECTLEEREVIIAALILMEADSDTTKEGKKLINKVLNKLGL